MRLSTWGLMGAALLTALSAGSSATASTAGPSVTAVNFCGVWLGSVSASGDHKSQGIFTTTTPPTVYDPVTEVKDLYPDGAARLASSMGV